MWNIFYQESKVTFCYFLHFSYPDFFQYVLECFFIERFFKKITFKYFICTVFRSSFYLTANIIALETISTLFFEKGSKSASEKKREVGKTKTSQLHLDFTSGETLCMSYNQFYFIVLKRILKKLSFFIKWIEVILIRVICKNFT